MNKGALEFSFNWIFSILVGAVIIFLAIYAANSFVKTERTFQDTETVQDLQALLNPLQTSVESSSKPAAINFPKEVRIATQCYPVPDLGVQELRLSSRNKIGGDWTSMSFPNKVNGYIFMNSPIEGKQLSVFLLPFSMPYKVADLIIIWTGEYCFVNSPDFVLQDLELLNGTGARFVNSLEQCASTDKKVCFSDSRTSSGNNCDIEVNTYLKQVRATGKSVYYEDSLLYAAIFSNPDLYECNVKRLASKTKFLADLYAKKSEVMGDKEFCGGAMQTEMQSFSSSINIRDSRDISALKVQAESLKTKQKELLCSLWK